MTFLVAAALKSSPVLKSCSCLAPSTSDTTWARSAKRVRSAWTKQGAFFARRPMDLAPPPSDGAEFLEEKDSTLRHKMALAVYLSFLRPPPPPFVAKITYRPSDPPLDAALLLRRVKLGVSRRAQDWRKNC